MLNGKEARKLKRLIKNYADWQEADSWKGGGDPESIPEIEKKFKDAKKKLNEYIQSLTVEDSHEDEPRRLRIAKTEGDS